MSNQKYIIIDYTINQYIKTCLLKQLEIDIIQIYLANQISI